jgi:hypothetical protein
VYQEIKSIGLSIKKGFSTSIVIEEMSEMKNECLSVHERGVEYFLHLTFEMSERALKALGQRLLSVRILPKMMLGTRSRTPNAVAPLPPRVLNLG